MLVEKKVKRYDVAFFAISSFLTDSVDAAIKGDVDGAVRHGVIQHKWFDGSTVLVPEGFQRGDRVSFLHENVFKIERS